MKSRKRSSLVKGKSKDKTENDVYQMLLEDGAQEQGDAKDGALSAGLSAEVLDETYRAALELLIPCSRCSRWFANTATLEDHLTSAHKSVSVNFSCDICAKGFKLQQSYNQHLLKVHNVKNPYRCDGCDIFFQRKRDFNAHHRVVHNGGPIFSCIHCSKSFGKKFLLKNHIFMQHDQGRPFHCHLCPKNFKTSRNLRCHYRLVHTSARPFVCDRCSASFKEKNVLLNHVRVQHDLILKYECHVCMKKFGYSATFKRHVAMVHEKANRFECHICSHVSYVDKRTLERHMSRIHSYGDEEARTSEELDIENLDINVLKVIFFTPCHPIKEEKVESLECFAFRDSDTTNITIHSGEVDTITFN